MSRILQGKDQKRLSGLAERLEDGERFTWRVSRKKDEDVLSAVSKQKKPAEHILILSVDRNALSRGELLKKTAAGMAYLVGKCGVDQKAIQEGFLLKGDKGEHFTDFLLFFARHRK